MMLAVLFLGTGMPGWAQPTISVLPGAASPGTQAVVQVRLNTGSLAVTSFQFTLEYDATIASFQSAVLGAGLSSPFQVTNAVVGLFNDNGTPGTDQNVIVQIRGNGVTSFSGSSVHVATLTFAIDPAACGVTPLAFSSICQRTHLSDGVATTCPGSGLSLASGQLDTGCTPPSTRRPGPC
jgi:hypothetical protein